MKSIIENKSNKIPIVAGVILLLGYSVFSYLQIPLVKAATSIPDFISFFIRKFCPPNFDNILNYLPTVLDTVLFAIVATYCSAILSLICGLLMSEKTNPIVPVRIFVRAILSFLRNIPVLVWASLLVYIFGVGKIVGLLALLIATLGFLSRSYADNLSEVAGEKMDALKVTGASHLQVLFHGVIPEFIPAWMNWTLFSFEINIRASAILGMVGAGGIGVMIQTKIKLFQYQEASAIIILVILIVVCTEFMTNRLRRMVH